ncbi:MULTISPECIES: alpha-glucosidase [unclassified Arthrobacter]|uniref:alpha-glucosidase n=1 Tax=unclassified Arthrobacter TaxID=235627 RepID=UPI001C84CB8D|nr:alpha-glucosidase [Arthrobacter sp. MAHUQ-56]MBX7445896.1 alpha-glucosidase [Arthrobacter sp. MAHUQ-56]
MTLQPLLRHPSLRPTDEWWKAAVVYQVYPRSFADSNGDGIGDIRGIINRLDHLENLGIDVVWLSPVYTSPQDDNGYDISDYYAVDPTFGTLEDLDELIAAMHARGMKLVMDLVVNHTSDEHAWFQESRASRTSAKRDWYIWRDPRTSQEHEAGNEPNNWGSFFSGSAWELDEGTGQYFLHLFSRKQPDLNWDNPEVRAAIYKMMNWWLDRGIDGFRMDVISFISKHPGLPDGPVENGTTWGNGIPFYGSGPHVHEYLQEMHREVFRGRETELMTVGEMVDATPELARLYTDPDRKELDMVFHFEHVGLDHGPGGKFTRKALDLVEVKRSFARWQEALADVGWNSLYWNNHDQPRVVSRFGNDTGYWYESATALATVLHLMRGTPYIYQGEELGMTNMPFEGIEDFRDLESLNYYYEALTGNDGSEAAAELLAGIATGGRDNARTPVQWDATPNAGFTTGDPWIPVNPNHLWLNAAAQRTDPGSVFSWYRSLVRLRHEEPVVIDGRFTLLCPEDPQLFVYTRTSETTSLMVLANCSTTPRALNLQLARELAMRWVSAEVLLHNHPEKSWDRQELRPWEVVVLRRSA